MQRPLLALDRKLVEALHRVAAKSECLNEFDRHTNQEEKRQQVFVCRIGRIFRVTPATVSRQGTNHRGELGPKITSAGWPPVARGAAVSATTPCSRTRRRG